MVFGLGYGGLRIWVMLVGVDESCFGMVGYDWNGVSD